MSQFRGFSGKALAFYEGLEQDNSKDYWTAHKTAYETEVASRCGPCWVPSRRSLDQEAVSQERGLRDSR
jgi:hypothetical protein